MSVLDATTTVPTMTLASLAALAAFTTCLLIRQWRLHRQCGIGETAGPPIEWDEQEQPRPPAAPAGAGHNTEQAAS